MMDRFIRETDADPETGTDVLMDRGELPRDVPEGDRVDESMFPQPRTSEEGVEDEVVPGDTARWVKGA
jgi:hypothetical protein